MKRLLILLVALGLLVAFTAPASAAKPDKPEPELVEVTLTGHLDTGLCEGPLLMEEGRKGSLLTGQDGPSTPRIFIHADPLMWSREYPIPGDSGEFFDGCHGGFVEGSPIEWDGSLWITLTGDSVEILWLFDHYWEEVPKNPNRPDGPTTNLIENFVLMGEAFDPDGNGLYEGDFTIRLHGGEPFGTATMAFTIEIVDVP